MTPHARVFSLNDQLSFADLSGDYNPIHVNPVAARRLLFGEAVVHGVHLVLWALDTVAQNNAAFRVKAIRAVFRNPVLLGSSVRIDQISPTELHVVQEGETLTEITIELHTEHRNTLSVPLPTPWSQDPAPLTLDQIADATGQLDLVLDPAKLAQLFPSLAQQADPYQMAVLLATTRLVGMACPGLHSLFSEIDLRFSDSPAEAGLLQYQTTFCHPDLKLVEITLNGVGLTGKLVSFLRPTPTASVEMEAVRGLVTGTPFMGRQALVIGGSRGLGEVASKLLAVGGAQVVLTYAQGADDAAAVVKAIQNVGGRAQAIQMDIQADDWEADFAAPTDLYYFPTPKIRQGPRHGFDAALYDLYSAYFVTAFARVIGRFSTPLRVLYPSTIFVEEPEPRFAEYAAAKAAGETLCAYLEREDPGRVIKVIRFPRLQTDQNAAIASTDLPVPANVLRPYLD